MEQRLHIERLNVTRAIGLTCNRATNGTGVPFVVTVDFTHASDGHVTIRERDSCEQIRVPETELPALMAALDIDVTWQQASCCAPCPLPLPCHVLHESPRSVVRKLNHSLNTCVGHRQRSVFRRSVAE